MGGADRNAKRRRQQAGDQRLVAAGITPPARTANRTPLVVVGAVLAIAVLVGVTVLLNRGSDDAPVAADYQVSASGAVITAGRGPVTVDIWTDYLCPFCERFESRYGEDLARALNAGQITVRYHAVGLLDSRSDPPGYSTRAAAASLCAVDAGIFPAYHERLFVEQPSEGGPGLSEERLAALGAELGAPAGFTECVLSDAHEQAVVAETQAMLDNPVLRGERGVGTPSVVVDGQRVDVNSDWLERATGA